MALFTSIANGNWSTALQAVWDIAGVPGDGDTTIIGHDILVDDARTIGTSPADATTMVVSVGTAGTLTIDGTLTVKGNLSNNAGSSGNVTSGLIIGAGGVLEFESAGAQVYDLSMGFYANIDVNGTVGSHATIRTVDNSNAHARIRRTLDETMGITADYCDFVRIGDNSNQCLEAMTRTPGSFPDTGHLVNCTFTNCGAIKVGAKQTGGSFSIADCQIIDPSETALVFSFAGVIGSTGTLEFLRCVVDGLSTCSPPANITVENNYFAKKLTAFGVTSADTFTSFTGNLIRYPADGASNWDADMADSIMLYDSPGENPSTLNLNAAFADRSITGNIIDVNGAPFQGDLLLLRSTSTFQNIIKNNIMVPQSAGLAPGKFTSDDEQISDSDCVIEHNTYYSGVDSETQPETGIGVGEADTGHTGQISSFKSNLIWTTSGVTGGYKLVRQQSAKQDFVLSANCVANWGWNLSAGSEGDGYHAWTSYQATAIFSSGTPDDDAAAGNGDPQFVDSTRNTARYDIDELGTAVATAWSGSSVSYVIGDERSNDDAGYYDGDTFNYRCIADHTSGASTEPGVGASWRDEWELASLFRLREDTSRIAAMITWIKEGFQVQNSDLEDAGHDGATIGAMGFLAPTGFIPYPHVPGMTGGIAT